jgi:hypothetical protein
MAKLSGSEYSDDFNDYTDEELMALSKPKKVETREGKTYLPSSKVPGREVSVEKAKVKPKEKSIEKEKVSVKPLSAIPSGYDSAEAEDVLNRVAEHTGTRNPKSILKHFDDDEAQEHLRSRIQEANSIYDAAEEKLPVNEKGIEEETLFGLLPKGDTKSLSGLAEDVGPMVLGGAAIGAGARGLKALKGAKAAVDPALMAPEKLWEKIGKTAKEAGGKDALMVQGGERLPTKTGAVQRLFFKEAGDNAGSAGLKREGKEAIGNASDFKRGLERFNKQLLKGPEDAKVTTMANQLRSMGFSEKEIVEILRKNWGK